MDQDRSDKTGSAIAGVFAKPYDAWPGDGKGTPKPKQESGRPTADQSEGSWWKRRQPAGQKTS